jgi:hypothetical protein
MTPNHEAMSTATAMLQAWTDFWAKQVEAGTDFTNVLLDSAGGEGPADMEALRRRWLESLAKSMDVYLRTPAFLETMHRHFDAVTYAKRNADDLAKEVARNTGFPHLDDISGLFERLQIGQEAILDRLTAIERRLDAVETIKKSNGQRKAHSH